MFEHYLVIGLSTLIILLFYSGKIGVDSTALFGLSIFLILGLITPREAFEGFSSDAVVLMIGSFFLSGALKVTGVADRFGRAMQKFSGHSEARAVFITMAVGATISSVINNTAAVAVMLPAVATLAQRAKVAPYKLYIPLTFAVLLGGTSTLIGTSSNLLAAEALQRAGYESFTMLEFLPLGMILIIIGLIYFIFAGRFILRIGRSEKEVKSRESLSSVYQLNERIFQIELPSTSMLGGRTLRDLDFNHHLGMEILAIERHGSRIAHLTPGSVIQVNDKLFVRGRSEELKQILRLSSGELVTLPSDLLSEDEQKQFCSVEFKVTSELLAYGSTLATIEFRHNTGMHIALIRREHDVKGDDLPHTILRVGDILTAYGPVRSIERLAKVGLRRNDLTIFSIQNQPKQLLFGFQLPKDVDLSGVKVRELGLQEVLGVTVIAIKREGLLHQSISGNDVVKSGDTLIIVGDPSAVTLLNKLAGSAIVDKPPTIDLESENVSLQEVVLAPRSKLIGKTLADVQFAARYGLKVMSLWRDGQPKRTRFSASPLKFGDTLLLRGERDKFELLGRDADFVVLTTDYSGAIRSEKAGWALFAFFMLVILSAAQVFAPSVVTLIMCLILVLSGALRLEEAYREIDWRLIMIVGALLPFQTLLPRYGITQEVALLIGNVIEDHGVIAVALILVLSSCFLTQVLDSTIAVIALAPVAISLAEARGLPAHPMVMAVAVGASLGFLTPLGHRAHLLVIAPGGYRTIDFVRVGTLLTLITAGATAIFCASGTGFFF